MKWDGPPKPGIPGPRHLWSIGLVAAVVTITVLMAVQLARQPDSGSASDTVAHQTHHPAVNTPRPAALTDADACRGNTAPRLAKVSISEQRLWFCELQRPVNSSPVTTGSVALGHGTPTGTWRVLYHETNRHLGGPGYTVFVRYWVPFLGDFGFHDSPWQRIPYGDREQYTTRGSQGCVHVPGPTMAAFYRWAVDGTRVTIVA
ncbi:MAG: L,D-transpeptidase [Gordonia sp. (in: high G+C Gram-positive bacteria)]